MPRRTPSEDSRITPRLLLMTLLAAGSGVAAYRSTAWSTAISVGIAVYVALDHVLSDRI